MMKTLPADARVMVAGASRGIGLGFVRALLEQPELAQVFAACRDPRGCEDLQRLSEVHGQRLQLLPLDVTDDASIAAAARVVRTAAPQLHLLINTVGVLHDDGQGLAPERKLADVDLASLQRAFAVNAFGPLLLAKHFADLLIHEQRAVFASLSARVGSIGDNRLGGWYAYRASKTAQNQLIHTLAIEMARRAPRLICVLLHPGTVDTGLSQPFQSGVAPGKLFDVERACAQLLEVIEGLERRHSGQFLAWDGSLIPW